MSIVWLHKLNVTMEQEGSLNFLFTKNDVYDFVAIFLIKRSTL